MRSSFQPGQRDETLVSRGSDGKLKTRQLQTAVFKTLFNIAASVDLDGGGFFQSLQSSDWKWQKTLAGDQEPVAEKKVEGLKEH